jgi:8-oxo-dGTP pyrophosphatase MutT (NUDIX family)
MLTDQLLAALRSHDAHDADEAQHLVDTIAFVEHHALDTWWQRSTLEGHVTASAWVIDHDGRNTLLLHHAKLGRWLQPGGHLDAGDASPADGALREAMEETGQAALKIASPKLFDVDVHAIPARHAEPGHLHYDLRYLIISTNRGVSISHESLGAKWLPIDSIVAGNFERSIARMAEKTQRQKST